MSDKSVLIIATMTAHPGKGDALFDVLNHCVAPSRFEQGNIHYDLYRSAENSDRFLFHETWKNASAVDHHEAQPHFKKLLAAAGPLLAEPPVINKF
ncbi:putative quinol monooxygenase [Erwinia pyrifoliae]|uniref:Antibiotic biosynthesis monooxygenase n=1 Tax=Erwinia pyrifoliae TaxID=79967 RepID=A0ABY5XD52_ERWPY|nr:putative quinol monooxygenase [Erwinia pyrifoliae]AUX72786.1 antibiotic biosynthesis monooxygenase [Erwinia pyrifoliae]MCA8876951.1 antibiotic biosynthesis monooxygenase [Erwinia pyrifoliae]UWS31156.1 antibiotic biosynthesis monooxygenase [Erwinia pyrifoliae]UWS35045.1 antibiotic biosynthesis monooxygenase [Erwinia pyrifoliae]CAX55506.1 Antibiotic biosynthesis monooxygenase [Erwinia pyrifoliae Ep1/96]